MDRDIRSRRRRHENQRYAGDNFFNSNFSTRENDRGFGRINERRRNFEEENIDYPSGREYSDSGRDLDRSREYDYNRFGMGDQGSTWNQRGDESYDFGEHKRRAEPKHRGKGPKGFIRTDERIREDINCRLTDDAYVDASDVEVTVSNGEVTLTGTVPDKSSKRRAEDISELVSGVSNVENRLRVK